jgi:hypothetical protein
MVRSEKGETVAKLFSIKPALSLKGRKFKGIRGFAGKPFHPPLTDIPVAAYILAAVFDLISFRGFEHGRKGLLHIRHLRPRRRPDRVGAHGPDRILGLAVVDAEAYAGMAHGELAHGGHAHRDGHRHRRHTGEAR